MSSLAKFVATGAYCGFSPIAPGTVGSFLALILYWLLLSANGGILAAVVAGFFFIGVWAAAKAEKEFGEDAAVIVIDEMVGMWIAFMFAKKIWVLIIGGFFFYRFLDIVKPFPINSAQKFPEGWGIMMDDLIAGIYTNLALQLVLILY